MDYNRYELLKKDDGTYKQMPFVNIPKQSTDKYVEWNINGSRYDKLSNKYYGSPFYDFLLTFANPQYLSEFEINTGEIIRIPFPLTNALETYELALKKYNKKNIK